MLSELVLNSFSRWFHCQRLQSLLAKNNTETPTFLDQELLGIFLIDCLVSVKVLSSKERRS
jgi:hypothetical protein